MSVMEKVMDAMKDSRAAAERDGRAPKAPSRIRKLLASLSPRGHEIPCDIPVEVPLGYQQPLSLEERLQRMVTSARFADMARAQGTETFEEFNDFEGIEDGYPDPLSGYEIRDMEPVFPPEAPTPPAAQPQPPQQAAEPPAPNPQPPLDKSQQ